MSRAESKREKWMGRLSGAGGAVRSQLSLWNNELNHKAKSSSSFTESSGNLLGCICWESNILCVDFEITSVDLNEES